MSDRIRLLPGDSRPPSRVYTLDEFRFEGRLSREERRLLARVRSLQALLREKESLVRVLRSLARRGVR
jgi:hypothetical protein